MPGFNMRISASRLLWLISTPFILTMACVGGRERAEPSTVTILYPGNERVLGIEGSYTPAQFMVFLPLVARGADGELEPALAKRWEHSDDHKTWTVSLRTDVRWHDGVPVTAYDVEYTLDLVTHPDVAFESPDAFSVTVLDDSTYTITYTDHPTYGSPVSGIAVYSAIYPKHLLENLDPSDHTSWEFWTQPVGNGPYRYVRHEPQTMIELEANPDFHKGRPSIDRVVLKFGDPSILELLAGNVDAVPYVDRMDLLKVRGDRRFEVYDDILIDATQAIVWNQRVPMFAEPSVRRALTVAIDRPALHRALNLPTDLPFFDVVFTGRQFRRGDVPAPLPHDPEQARALLAQSGWTDEDGDGVRDRDGDAFAFTLIVSAWSQGPRIAVLVQDQLREVGIRMEVQTMETASLFERIWASDFEAAFVPMFSGGGLSHHTFFGEGSVLGYANPDVGRLLEQVSSSFDPAIIDGLYAELMPMLQADLPMTYLYPDVRSTVAHRRLRGLSSPYRAEPTWHMEELWIDEEG